MEDEEGLQDEGGGERLVKFIVALGTGRQLTHPLMITSEVSSHKYLKCSTAFHWIECNPFNCHWRSFHSLRPCEMSRIKLVTSSLCRVSC